MSTPNFYNQKDFDLYIKAYEPEGEYNEIEAEIFYEDVVYGYDGFKEVMEELNDSLTFHSIEIKDGYYSGIQLYVNTTENPHELDNEDCKYYFDMYRSQAIRKYEVEIRKINKWMEKVAVGYGWRKLNCLGIFSNGEAIYQYA